MEHSKKRILITTIIGGILFIIGLSLFLVGLTIKRPVITYYDGDIVLSTEKVAIGNIGGKEYKPNKECEKDGYVYVFEGWKVDYTDELVYEIEVTEDRPYKASAQFKMVLYNYEITYNLNGGTNPTTAKNKYTIEDATYNLPTPTKYGYNFIGWFTDKNFTNKIEKIEKGSHEVYKLFAKWEAIKYKITYEMGGGTNDESNPLSYTIESKAIYLADATREGFIFDGWRDANGEIVKVIVEESTGDKYLTASWVKPITYHLNGGSNPSYAPISYKLGDSVELVEPTRFGYDFLGWYDNENFDNEPLTLLTDIDDVDVQLYAKWEKKDTIFEEDGVEYIYFGKYPQTVESDSNIIAQLEKLCEKSSSCVYDGTEYVKLVATPSSNSYFNSLVNSNNKIEAKTYYFKVEPIKWRILSSKDGKVELLCEYALDASIFGKKDKDIFANNYYNSVIREWLNGEFLDTAFTLDEKAAIQTTFVDNSAQSTFTETNNEYECDNTNDLVYLLSFKEASTPKYGFNSSRDEQDEKKGCFSTDYARAKGLSINLTDEYYGYVNWMLRSPFYNGDNGIAIVVGIEDNNNKLNTIAWGDATTVLGVRPAITITLE